MGVEAREQTEGEQGLVEKELTESDHPLVKHAEELTHRFDLVPEQKNVAYHLCELAKASITAVRHEGWDLSGVGMGQLSPTI